MTFHHGGRNWSRTQSLPKPGRRLAGNAIKHLNYMYVYSTQRMSRHKQLLSQCPQHYKRRGYFSHNEGLDGGNFSQVCSLEHQIFQYALGRRYNIQVNIGKHSHSITVLKFTLHIHVLNGLRVNSLNGLAGAKLLVQLCSFRHYLSILNFRNFTVSGIY